MSANYSVGGWLVERRPGEYLSNPNTNGTGSSYTRILQRARVFPSYEAAKAECCENEHPKALSEAFV